MVKCTSHLGIGATKWTTVLNSQEGATSTSFNNNNGKCDQHHSTSHLLPHQQPSHPDHQGSGIKMMKFNTSRNMLQQYYYLIGLLVWGMLLMSYPSKYIACFLDHNP